MYLLFKKNAFFRFLVIAHHSVHSFYTQNPTVVNKWNKEKCILFYMSNPLCYLSSMETKNTGKTVQEWNKAGKGFYQTVFLIYILCVKQILVIYTQNQSYPWSFLYQIFIPQISFKIVKQFFLSISVSRNNAYFSHNMMINHNISVAYATVKKFKIQI